MEAGTEQERQVCFRQVDQCLRPIDQQLASIVRRLQGDGVDAAVCLDLEAARVYLGGCAIGCARNSC
jgi:hypothetical protein